MKVSARVSKSLHTGVGAASWGSEEEAPVQLEGLAKAALGRDPGVRKQGPPQWSASRGRTLLCGRISQLEASAQNQGLQEQPEAPRARPNKPSMEVHPETGPTGDAADTSRDLGQGAPLETLALHTHGLAPELPQGQGRSSLPVSSLPLFICKGEEVGSSDFLGVSPQETEEKTFLLGAVLGALSVKLESLTVLLI